ncbi:MAG TPA: ABC transporter permease [Tepidisphaeraceae bacterium]|jgi:peptide/nickel transport system permease protein|nr:ABC transporter permease [Tepidisphaeraceae bacterium]
MWAYIVRRLLLSIPILIGIVILTFLLFDVVAPDPAIVYAGKFKSVEQLQAIRHQLGTDVPKWRQFVNILTFHFAPSFRYQESVWSLLARKAPISLAIQIPAFFIELGLQLVLALFVASRRGTILDYGVTLIAVLGMSVPIISLYLGAQWIFGGWLRWFPVAGWSPGFFYALHFAALPIIVSVIGGVGGGVRFYRTIVLEEINADYVRTARAKGVPAREVLFTHVFGNVLIPVLTNTIVVLPLLFTGSLVLEQLFQIPGFGALLVESIHAQDQPVVMFIVYITSLIYLVMLIFTDILYTLVDPRVTLK